MLMSRRQSAGQSLRMKISDSGFKFQATLDANACCHYVQNLFSYRLLHTNLYIPIPKLQYYLLFCTGVKFGLLL